MPRVRCVSCREWTPARLLEEQTGLAQCLECGTLTNDAERIDLEGATAPAVKQPTTPPALPAGCEVSEVEPLRIDDAGRQPLLRVRGPAPKRHPLWVALELFAIIVVFAAMTTGLVSAGETGLALLTLPPAIAAFVFVYLFRVPDASRPVLTVGDEVLLLRRRPFPWRKRYLTKRFVMYVSVRQAYDDVDAPDSFEIVAVLRSGERVVLLEGFEHPSAAMHLGDRIARRWV